MTAPVGLGAERVVELRRYTLHPGSREVLLDLFERELVAPQEAAGMRLGGRFRDLDDADKFVWLRSFPDMPARARALTAFYDGPVWHEHRAAANATMVDSDDVRLLCGDHVAVPDGAKLVVATVCHPRDPASFRDEFELRIRPDLEAAGTPPFAVARTLHAENTFPRLPVRTGEDVFVWFTAYFDDTARPDALNDILPSDELLGAPEVLRLSPVRVTTSSAQAT